MGKRGIDVSTFKSALNQSVLYFLLVLVIVSGLFLSGCNETDIPDEFTACSGIESTQVNEYDESILCIYPNEDSSNDETEACLRTSNGNAATSKVVNQMYSMYFYQMYEYDDEADSRGVEEYDYTAAAAIAADHHYGDAEYCGSSDKDCWERDGFKNDAHNDGDGNRDPGTAENGCITWHDLELDDLDANHGTANDYGIDKYELQSINEAIGNEFNDISPLAYCFDSGDYSDVEGTKFDLEKSSDYFYTTEGYYFVQEIYPYEDSDEMKYVVFYCDGDEWLELDEMPNVDYDSTPDEFDCDENDPTQFIDMSIFYDEEAGYSNQSSFEICGDGKSNICQTSLIYNWGFLALGEIEPQEDNCDYNPYACENNCLEEGNECDFISYSETDESESTEDAEYPEGGEGYCCGADQVDDLGTIVTDPSLGSNQVCLNLESGENYMVGAPDDVKTAMKGGEESSACPNEWCWVDPETNIFQVVTLKTNGEKSWDIVSNSENWFSCTDENILGTLEAPNPSDANDDIIEKYRYASNRFICYDQGDRNVWVECADPGAFSGFDPEQTNEDTVKFRNPGDGFFNLISDGTTISLTGDYGDGSDYYAQYRAYEYSVDFTGYDYLDFFVEFTNPEDLVHPINVRMEISGLGVDASSGEEVTYFDENILGYAITSPDLSGSEPIHVKVPIGDWLDVNVIDFRADGNAENEFTVKSLHLTKSENNVNYYCSGYDTKDIDNDYNSWIDDFDQSDEGNSVLGEKICTSHFGAEAWFGVYGGSREVDYESASCCGDDENEYYAGDTSEEAEELGCWNSKVIGNDETVMNVEYEVQYEVQDSNMSYPEQEFEYGLTLILSYIENLSGEQAYEYWDATSETNLDDGMVINPVDNLGISSGPIDIKYDESPKSIISYNGLLSKIHLQLDSNNAGYVDPEVELVLNWTENENVSLYLFDAKDQSNLGESVTLTMGEAEVLENFTIQLIAETNILETITENITNTSTFNYPCLQEECVYALPGNPPYKVTNFHPGLYELYYRFGNNDEDEILITHDAQEFTEDANLVVKKLSQQVLHYNQSFWGCNAADYISDLNIFTEFEGEDLTYCDIQGSYYCAYQDENYLVSTWSTDTLAEIGYEEIAEYEEDMEFELDTCDGDDLCAATDRNGSTSVVPGRNFVPNAEFDSPNGDITAWKIRDSTNTLVANEDDYEKDGVVTLESGYILWSEKIAIYPNMNYQFSQNSSCSTNIYLYDSNGTETSQSTTSSLSFSSGSNTYAIIEVTGSCEFYGPMVQLVDDMGAQEYDYDDDYKYRKGAACCPEDMCWNGYICVNNMAPYTFMTETSGEVEYRCIDGQWTHMDPKYDWNFDEYGFCTTEDQCFVTSSLSEGADPDATPSDFYEGSYPTCINSSDYILDHYCEDGEWSSRTKYLATKLLNYAESQDYQLYCADLQTNYLDYDVSGYNYMNYIMGEGSGEVETETSLGEASSNDSSTGTSTDATSICFSALENSETGRRLVSTEENTCINNVCVLKYESGSDFNTAFATSMNLNTSADNSFLVPLGISSSDKEEFCADGDNTSDFQGCSEELWYAPEINSLIYAKDGISIESSLVDEIFDWFGSLFSSSTIQNNEDFLDEATNFNKLYMMSMDNGGYVVRAIEEKNINSTTLVAQYEGFSIPICEYINNTNEEYVMVEQWPAAPKYLVNCSMSDEGVYEVVTGANTDFWWPNLVGRLRFTGE